MGEKSGSLTNLIIVIVALVAILFFADTAFPDMVNQIAAKMQGILNDNL